MSEEPVPGSAALRALGQSLWLDSIQRQALENGEIKALIDRGEIRGMTSNPSIFNQAVAHSSDYDEAIRSLAWSGWDSEKIFWQLAIEDVQLALDLFAPLYEQSGGGDGYVSIEVSPRIGHDADATAAEAQRIWARVARPNLMVKIPATDAGIPAVRQTVAAGLNINVTLIFSRLRYAAIMDAYMSGLEDRLRAGHSIDRIASVASFFVSRVDSKIDGRLAPGSALRGKAALSNAKLAYQDFLRTFSGERWERLAKHGARLQRPLWASTSTKNPAYPDTLYVDELVGPDTVNTVPPQTLTAVREHARGAATISTDLDEARRSLAALEREGIRLEDVARELEVEGLAAFAASFDDLIGNIDARRGEAVGQIGPLAAPVARRVENLDLRSFMTRFLARDSALWSDSPGGKLEAARRLGWIDSPEKARARIPVYSEFASQARQDRLSRFLVLGMGGSSLAVEVMGSTFVTSDLSAAESLSSGILDSTDPDQVAEALQRFPVATSLYVVSSKSGGTAEVDAALEFFWEKSNGDGSRFVAITDEGTSLSDLAEKRSFRRIFNADPTVGGRYSALTDFGMLPAALLGIDLERLCLRAEAMQRECWRGVSVARSPGMVLGVILGEAALAGRDKLALLADPAISAFPQWIEQLVAESTGKNGKGILPLPREPLDAPEVYGSDRVFVYLRQTGVLDAGVAALVRAGFPVISIDVPDAYALGAEFYRWEVAVATTCHILGVNAFDQPDVQESKDRTMAKIEHYRSTRRLEEGTWDVELGDPGTDRASGVLETFLAAARKGDYIALNAYLPRRQDIIDELQRLSVLIRERTRLAVAAGFGPRFQHSTGQLHKGGANNGCFIQLVSDPVSDLPIPGRSMTFGSLIRAQALGDYETLVARQRRVLRVHLSRPDDIILLRRALQ